MKNSTKTLYLSALLIIAISAIFLANIYIHSSSPHTVQTAKPTAITAPTDTAIIKPSTSPTALVSASPSQSTNGTLYSNTAYGYEFTYPSGGRLGDNDGPPTPVSRTTKNICVTQPGSGVCSFGVKFVAANGPSMLTDEYIASIYPQYDAHYDTISVVTLNGLSGIQVVNGGLRDIYIETSSGIVLDFSDGQDTFSASIIPTIRLTR